MKNYMYELVPHAHLLAYVHGSIHPHERIKQTQARRREEERRGRGERLYEYKE
jgi:hypothetical protein